MKAVILRTEKKLCQHIKARLGPPKKSTFLSDSEKLNFCMGFIGQEHLHFVKQVAEEELGQCTTDQSWHIEAVEWHLNYLREFRNLDPEDETTKSIAAERLEMWEQAYQRFGLYPSDKKLDPLTAEQVEEAGERILFHLKNGETGQSAHSMFMTRVKPMLKDPSQTLKAHLTFQNTVIEPVYIHTIKELPWGIPANYRGFLALHASINPDFLGHPASFKYMQRFHEYSAVRYHSLYKKYQRQGQGKLAY